MDHTEKTAIALLKAATSAFEANPKAFREMGFLLVGPEAVPRPVAFETDPLVVEIAAGMFADDRARSGYIEQLSLNQLRQIATSVAPPSLAGVAYLFPASGDFPQNDVDAQLAMACASMGRGRTPWSMEGLVLVMDSPSGRRSWAALRPLGEVADPLEPPRAMRVHVDHITNLYPFSSFFARARYD